MRSSSQCRQRDAVSEEWFPAPTHHAKKHGRRCKLSYARRADRALRRPCLNTRFVQRCTHSVMHQGACRSSLCHHSSMRSMRSAAKVPDSVKTRPECSMLQRARKRRTAWLKKCLAWAVLPRPQNKSKKHTGSGGLLGRQYLRPWVGLLRHWCVLNRPKLCRAS